MDDENNRQPALDSAYEMKVRRGRRGDAHGPASGMEPFLAGGGDLGRLIAGFDWSTTPLGPIELWQQSLRSAVDICLSSRFPIVMYWGPELTVIYNDAYSEILGSKHPWALGKPCAVCWAEIWDTIGPMLAGVVDTGVATWSDDLELHLERHGAPEECYFSFSFGPVRIEDGSVGGVFTAVVETTGRVLNDRRLRILSRLGEHAGGAHSVDEALQRCAEAMQGSRAVPFSLLYADDGNGHARLAARSGIDSRSDACVTELDLASDSGPWPLAEVRDLGKPVHVRLAAGSVTPEVAWAHDVAPRRCLRSASRSRGAERHRAPRRPRA